MKRGAVDYLLEPFRGEELLSAVARGLAGSAALVDSRARLAKLTPRELEVFAWLIAGLINKEIAGEVGVTLRTIKEHRARVMQKTGTWIVERTFAWLARNRRLSKDYELKERGTLDGFFDLK